MRKLMLTLVIGAAAFTATLLPVGTTPTTHGVSFSVTGATLYIVNGTTPCKEIDPNGAIEAIVVPQNGNVQVRVCGIAWVEKGDSPAFKLWLVDQDWLNPDDTLGNTSVQVTEAEESDFKSFDVTFTVSCTDGKIEGEEKSGEKCAELMVERSTGGPPGSATRDNVNFGDSRKIPPLSGTLVHISCAKPTLLQAFDDCDDPEDMSSVGGVAEPPDVADSESGSSSRPYAALAGAAAGVFVLLVAGGRYARRCYSVRRR